MSRHKISLRAGRDRSVKIAWRVRTPVRSCLDHKTVLYIDNFLWGWKCRISTALFQHGTFPKKYLHDPKLRYRCGSPRRP